MAIIVITDDGIEFDGRTPENFPLGGAESSLIALAETLAFRGHQVSVYNMCRSSVEYKGVRWRPIYGELPETADLYIANRGDKLLKYVPKAKKVVFWCHNPANYMLKWRYIYKLWKRRPVVVFIGKYHAKTLPGWVPDGGRRTIPYGVSDIFCTSQIASQPPSPRAIFLSNPLRGLDWLLDRWSIEIQPYVRNSELHIFSGPATYGSKGGCKSQEMETVLNYARGLSEKSVILRAPVPKERLVLELGLSRCLLYRGDPNETFCSAVAEAQAMGVPCVVTDLGSMKERVVDGKTGFIVRDDKAFSDAARKLLEDDDMWRFQHGFALEKQRSWRWSDAALAFEEIINT